MIKPFAKKQKRAYKSPKNNDLHTGATASSCSNSSVYRTCFAFVVLGGDRAVDNPTAGVLRVADVININATMNKQEVAQRVLQNGKPLALDKFEWDEGTNTFFTDEDELVINFLDRCYYMLDFGSYCVFNIGSYFTFNVGSYCTLNVGPGCTLTTGSQCVVIRRDVFEVIELEEGKTIKLNGSGVKGYTVVEPENTEKKKLVAKARELQEKAQELLEQAEKM